MYQRLETALSRLIDGEQPIKGTLGYTIDGVYSVTVAENPAKYYVRFADGIGGGGFAQVYHRGRVSPVPDLPVEVGFDSAGNLVILGGDPARGELFDGGHEVGPHSHARGSGMEFPIDPRLLTPVKAAPLTGLTVDVAQGAYWYGGSLRWWGGGTITLTPPASANRWAWVVIGLDPAAGTLAAVSGTAVVVSAPLEPSTIPAISFDGLPLAAVRLRNGQTELDESEFEDLRYPLVALPGALDDLADVNTPSPSDGDVLTWDDGAGEWVSAPAGGTFSGDAFDVPYTPTTGGDWTEGEPSDVGDALDTLAARSAGGGGGSETLIAETTLASAATSIVFSSIPGTYDHLIIRGRIRTDRAATADGIIIEDNGDTTASHYSGQVFYGSVSTVAAIASANAVVGRATGGTADADEFGIFEIIYMFYALTDQWKISMSDWALGVQTWRHVSAGAWKNTAAITQLEIKPQTGTHLAAETHVQLIGVLVP